MSDLKELIRETERLAKRELEFCNPAETPEVCKLISTPEGKEKIVKLIVEYVGKNGMTISEAIVYIERENNPNLSN